MEKPLHVFTSSNSSTAIEWCGRSCTHIYWAVRSSHPTCSWHHVQIWLTSLLVVAWIHSHNLHRRILLILWIVLSCDLPFHTPHLLRMRIKLSTRLVLCSQTMPSFMMSVCGNLNKNPQWRMTPFQPCLIRFILTSLVILPFFISPMKTHFCMFLLPNGHRTRQMSVCHYSAKRPHLPLKSYPIFHLSFLKTRSVNILVSRLPHCMIHQIIRMLTNILNFLILVVMISLLLHLITMLIHSFLICLRHWSMIVENRNKNRYQCWK